MLAAGLKNALCAEHWLRSFVVSLVDAVLHVEVVHVARVNADDHHVDDQRALRRHVEAEREAEERDAFSSLAYQPSTNVTMNQTTSRIAVIDQVLVPVLPVLFSELQSGLPLVADQPRFLARPSRTSHCVTSGQNVLCAFELTERPMWPALEGPALDVLRADVVLEGLALAGRHQVIGAGHQDLERAGDLAEVDRLVAQLELALDQLVALVQLLDELAEGLAGDGDVVVGPLLHREVVLDELVVVHLVEERDVLAVVILHRLHHLEAGLEERGRDVAEGIDQGVDVEVIGVRPEGHQRLSLPAAKSMGAAMMVRVLTRSGLRAVKMVDIVPPMQ